MQTRVIAWAAACALFGSGCAEPYANSEGPQAPSAAQRPADTTQTTGATQSIRQGLLVWTSPGNSVTAELTNDNNLLGAVVSLHREPGGESGNPDETDFQGSVFNHPVSVTVHRSVASGILGTQPVDLHLSDEAPPGLTHVRGLIGGQLADLELGKNHFSGNIGRCGYQLVGNGHAYDGWRSCGAGRGQVRIEIGARLAPWTPLEKATVLALILRNS